MSSAEFDTSFAVEEQIDPDGRKFWIDFRPLPPTWKDPRYDPSDPLKPGFEEYVNPDGKRFFIDTRPRISWTKPEDIPEHEIGGRSLDPKALFTEEPSSIPSSIKEADSRKPSARSIPLKGSTLFDGASLRKTAKLDNQPHQEVKLLMTLTRWRLAQVLSGYPDSRTDEVDKIISLLETRIGAVSDITQLRPLETWFVKGATNLISGQPNLNFAAPRTSNAKMDGPLDPLQMIFHGVFKPFIYTILLGAPANYRRRLGRAEWIQWASSRRWTDQQKAMDGFLKSLVDEWNITILLATLFLSASVGFLTVDNLGRIAESSVLVSLIFSLSCIILSVLFVWRYQRQLSNSYDMQSVMDEFIYDADEEILPIFLSLPVSFLIWSIISFSVGVVSYSWSRLPNVESPVGVTSAMVVATVLSLVIWFLHRYMWMFKRKANWSERHPQLKGISVDTVPTANESVETIPMLNYGQTTRGSK